MTVPDFEACQTTCDAFHTDLGCVVCTRRGRGAAQRILATAPQLVLNDPTDDVSRPLWPRRAAIRTEPHLLARTCASPMRPCGHAAMRPCQFYRLKVRARGGFHCEMFSKDTFLTSTKNLLSNKTFTFKRLEVPCVSATGAASDGNATDAVALLSQPSTTAVDLTGAVDGDAPAPTGRRRPTTATAVSLVASSDHERLLGSSGSGVAADPAPGSGSPRADGVVGGTAPVAAVSRLRCLALAPFVKPEPGASVCGGSIIRGECRTAVPYAEAASVCYGVGARLCSARELRLNQARWVQGCPARLATHPHLHAAPVPTPGPTPMPAPSSSAARTVMR